MNVSYKNIARKTFRRHFFSPTNPSPNETPVLQPSLFRHSLALSSIIGLVSADYPLRGATAALILLWIDSRYWKKKTLILFSLFFTVGLLLGSYSKSTPPNHTPLWLSPCLDLRKHIRITGVVKTVRSSPNRRLNITLENVFPEYPKISKTSNQAAPLPSGLLLTLDNPSSSSTKPLPGQKITVTATVRFLYGFRNNDVYNVAHTWRKQNLYFQAWLKGSDGDLVVSGDPGPFAAIRETLCQKVVAPLLQDDCLQVDDQNASNICEETTLGKSFIPALLFGDRFFISNNLYTLVCHTGVAHSLALSGQHLSVVLLIGLAVIAILFKPSPRTFMFIPRYKMLPLISAPLAFIYLWLGNAPLSLLRATSMLFLWTAYKVKNASVVFADVIVVALCCIVLFDPQNIYSVGLQLSFISVFAISAASPLAYKALSVFKSRLGLKRSSPFLKKTFFALGSALLTAALITLTAQISTLPLSVYIFGYASPWFLINVFWAPVLNLFILPLAFLGLLFFLASIPKLGYCCLDVASFPCELLVRLLVTLNRKGLVEPLWLPRPHWTEVVGLYLALLSALTLLGRTRTPAVTKRIFFASFIMLTIAPASRYIFHNPHTLKLRVMDVGQGQAVLLEWGDRKQALIDAGGFYSKNFDTGKDILRPALSANGPLNLNFIALTHPHRDHIKGFLFLAKTFQINQAYTALLPTIDVSAGKRSLLALEFDTILKQRAIPRIIVARGDRIYLEKNVFLEILSPPKGVIPKGNAGLIFRLVANGRGLALIPGDAERKDLKELLKTKQNLQADVLILPHHGSKTGFVPKFYLAARPLIAVASSGVLNKHDLPSPELHDMLLKNNIPLRTTAQEGEIVFEWDLRSI